MIINLNETVNVEELSELFLSGIEIGKGCRVELTFSKEALIGFATNLIWLYEDIDNEKNVHFHIDPLGGEIQGNQALGFFLTPESPSLVVQVEQMKKLNYCEEKIVGCKEMSIRRGICNKIEIRDPVCDEAIEEYELGLKNIVDIKIINGVCQNVSNMCVQIVFKLGYDTLKKFATMLMILANNYSKSDKYLLANLGQFRTQYNMGVIFTKESPDVVIKCDDLGCVYDYEPNFGILL